MVGKQISSIPLSVERHLGLIVKQCVGGGKETIIEYQFEFEDSLLNEKQKKSSQSH